MGRHRRLIAALALGALLLSSMLLTGCDPSDSIARPVEEVHMYGDAVDANSFAKVANARITVQIDNHRQTFTGSYDILAPVHHPLTITVTAPGYQDYHAQTALNTQAEDELRSPLLLHPVGQ